MHLQIRPFAIAFCLVAGLLAATHPPEAAAGSRHGGVLQIVTPDGSPAPPCPLRHTSVRSEIAGIFARTTVTQTFHNPLDRVIEAVYVFPLPEDAAVDEMEMLVGGRRVLGMIKERDEARRIYEDARAAGHVTGLLDQERANVFTQSVANIEPGAEVEIRIGYVETLPVEDGELSWVFPTVVGPRYTPAGVEPVASPVAPAGMRSGHDISIEVAIDGGGELFDLRSELHEIDLRRDGSTRATVTLRQGPAIPNRDFVLRYRLADSTIGHALLTHRDERGEFFTLILQPPRRVAPRHVVPRELIFVLDSSGSMSGFPMERARQLMTRMIDTMNAQDTFNVITFAGHTRILWDEPRANTDADRREARSFVATSRGGGGTAMMPAIEAALTKRGPRENDRLRVVVFLTDGYVSDDMAIVDAVRRHADTTRVFSFGVGNAVNRFLLDGLAHAGRGVAEYVTLDGGDDAADETVRRLHERMLAPVLTDIEIDWGTLPVRDLHPSRIPDLFSAGPITVHGRLDHAASGTITLRGRSGDGLYEQAIELAPTTSSGTASLPSLWSRARVDDLLQRDLAALQAGRFPASSKAEVLALGLEYRLMTPFTSFVAVEERTITSGGEPETVLVPVEMPDGVSREGVYGGAPTQVVVSGPAFAKRAPALLASRPAALAPQGIAERVTVTSQRPAADVGGPVASGLDPVLRGLAARVARDGVDGTLRADGVEVVDHRIRIVVTLRDRSRATLRALDRLGFETIGAGAARRELRGTIDVRGLEALAALDVVIAVRPAGAEDPM